MVLVERHVTQRTDVEPGDVAPVVEDRGGVGDTRTVRRLDVPEVPGPGTVPASWVDGTTVWVTDVTSTGRREVRRGPGDTDSSPRGVDVGRGSPSGVYRAPDLRDVSRRVT